MGESKKLNYRRLINRNVAIASCFVGIWQAFVATCLLICAFIFLGEFCKKLECVGITDGIGFWLGFPLLIPAILGVIVLGTRHKKAAQFMTLANFIVGIVCIIHLVYAIKDDDDFWSPAADHYESGRCSPSGFLGCSCQQSDYTYPFRCDLINFGHEMNWVMFGLGIASIVLCLFGFTAGVVGIALQKGQE